MENRNRNYLLVNNWLQSNWMRWNVRTWDLDGKYQRSIQSSTERY